MASRLIPRSAGRRLADRKRARVFAINPMSPPRPDRHPVSRKKSDPGDSLGLANIPPHRHARPPPLPQ
ncbi:hypothetical protein E4K10_43165 [Streptomyces sp. T1317-0309]|nr:hypothetical protein E4K10_43165 [Streptomyces sp. T1317-0309]